MGVVDLQGGFRFAWWRLHNIISIEGGQKVINQSCIYAFELFLDWRFNIWSIFSYLKSFIIVVIFLFEWRYLSSGYNAHMNTVDSFLPIYMDFVVSIQPWNYIKGLELWCLMPLSTILLLKVTLNTISLTLQQYVVESDIKHHIPNPTTICCWKWH